jgi:hypothetical protein
MHGVVPAAESPSQASSVTACAGAFGIVLAAERRRDMLRTWRILP